MVPPELRYTKDHEWIRVADGAIHFGTQLLQAAEDRSPVTAEHLAFGQMPGGVLE